MESTDKIDLEVVVLGPEENLVIDNSNDTAVVVLGGRIRVVSDKKSLHELELGERENVFSGKASAVFFPSSTNSSIVSLSKFVELAIVKVQPVNQSKALAILPDDVTSEIRGKGTWKREVFDILRAEHEQNGLCIGETYSTSGVWSGFPPHKHDTDTDTETKKNEVFLFKFSPSQGFATLFNYTKDVSDGEPKIVRDGDIVGIKSGYHCLVSAPEYKFYYLWILKGKNNSLKMETDQQHNWLAENKR